MKTILKVFIAMLAAWIGGLAVILLQLYFGNGGSDFTFTDFMGFGVLFVAASGLLMLAVYFPGLLWFRRKTSNQLLFPIFSGLLLNLPIFIVLGILAGRKMSPTEALGFMLTFLTAGLLFGFVFGKRSPRAEP